MIKLIKGTPDEVVVGTIIEELEKECAPFRLMLTSIDAVELYRVFFKTVNPPKGTWMEIDEIGNIWISSKKEGKHYDCIPHGDVTAMLANAGLENYIDFIGVNGEIFGPYFLVISMPTDEDHKRVSSYYYKFEACAKLRAKKDRSGFVETLLW